MPKRSNSLSCQAESKCSLFSIHRNFLVNRKYLITLTLVGPTWENLVTDPLAVQKIDNQLSLFCCLHTFNYFIFSCLLHFSVCLLVQLLLGTLFLLFLFSFVILCSADYFCWSNCSKICKGFFSSSLQRESRRWCCAGGPRHCNFTTDLFYCPNQINKLK